MMLVALATILLMLAFATPYRTYAQLALVCGGALSVGS